LTLSVKGPYLDHKNFIDDILNSSNVVALRNRHIHAQTDTIQKTTPSLGYRWAGGKYLLLLVAVVIMLCYSVLAKVVQLELLENSTESFPKISSK